jgi:hypothetical protein
MNEHGLGALPSPFDSRDFPIEQLYALTGKTPALAIPANYRVPGELNPILDQGSTPQCVAYSSAALKGTEDRIDQGQFFDWDTGTFFVQIGGGSNGAYVRDAFKAMLSNGYPVKKIGGAADHKIAAYYAVNPTLAEVQAALMAFGPLVFGMTWLNSMFTPAANGVLTVTQSSGVAGGHAILCVGWTVVSGKTYLILRNSWGTAWGLSGEAYLPAASLPTLVGEVWKAVDVIETPPEGNMVKFTVTAPPNGAMGPGFGTMLTGSARKLVDLATGALVTPTLTVYTLLAEVDLLGAVFGGSARHRAWLISQAGVPLFLLEGDATITAPAPPAPADFSMLVHLGITNGLPTVSKA